MKTMISTFTACALSLALGMPAFAETPAPAPASVAPVKSDSAKVTPTKSVKKHRKHAPNTVPAAAPASH